MLSTLKQRASLVSVAALLVGAPTFALAQQAPNLFANPSFDAATCHDQWTVRPADLVNIICSRDAGMVWLNYNNQGEDPNVSQRIGNLTPGETYRITATWRPGPTAHTYAPGQTRIFAIGVDGTFTAMNYEGNGTALQTSLLDFVATGTEATIAFAGEYGYDADVSLDSVSMVAAGTFGTGNEYLTSESVAVASQAPATMSGPARIGIRWESSNCSNVDVDLFVRQDANVPYLNWEHLSEPWGNYGEDIHSGGGASYEEVTLNNVPDIHAIGVRINHFMGACPDAIHGEVRAQFAGQVYSTPFTMTGRPTYQSEEDFNARHGTVTGDTESWVDIDPAALFRLQ